MNDSLTVAQRLIGFLAVAAFLLLAWQSMDPGYDLSLPMIAGIILIIAMLLGKVDAVATLIEKWRGGGGGGQR